jgi:DNA polymerase III subunit alpha
MTRWLVQMKPKTLDNIIAMVALYRPGPMAFIPDYIARMHGEAEVEYRHPKLEPIFRDTYGIPVYQEQLMRAAVELAGYTPSESDELRKAISKKKKEEIEKHRKKFVAGAVRQGMDKETAEAIYSDWEEFARYGFNKSHAADYGVIAVETAYLKVHYTAEYMAALLSASAGQTEKVALYVADARSMGVPVLPPEINASAGISTSRTLRGKPSIRFGLGAIKNAGPGGGGADH